MWITAKATNTHMKDKTPRKGKEDKKKWIQINLANQVLDLLHDFELNLTLLNEMIYATATVTNQVTVTHTKYY